MPSFKTVFFALATLSATVFATPVDTGSDVFANPHALAKRAVGAEDFSEHGSELEKRARNNIGRRCRRNRQCYTNLNLATAFCNRNGRCDFKCRGNAVRQGNHCVGAHNAPKCRFNANCPRTNVKNASARCGPNGKCTFKCNSGWHAQGNRCVKNDHLCGGRSCPHVGNGYAICQNGRWVPQCNFYLGYKLYQRNGQYNCINTANDPANCGRVGRACPVGYNGLGNRTCRGGVCDLSCGAGLRKRTLPNGQPYCSRI